MSYARVPAFRTCICLLACLRVCQLWRFFASVLVLRAAVLPFFTRRFEGKSCCSLSCHACPTKHQRKREKESFCQFPHSNMCAPMI